MAESYVTRVEASKYLKDRYKIGAVRWLAKLATIGDGPTFRKIGQRVLYRLTDLDEWAEARMTGPLKSTSDNEAR